MQHHRHARLCPPAVLPGLPNRPPGHEPPVADAAASCWPAATFVRFGEDWCSPGPSKLPAGGEGGCGLLLLLRRVGSLTAREPCRHQVCVQLMEEHMARTHLTCWCDTACPAPAKLTAAVIVYCLTLLAAWSGCGERAPASRSGLYSSAGSPIRAPAAC